MKILFTIVVALLGLISSLAADEKERQDRPVFARDDRLYTSRNSRDI